MKGKKSICLQSGRLQCFPRSGNCGVPIQFSGLFFFLFCNIFYFLWTIFKIPGNWVLALLKIWKSQMPGKRRQGVVNVQPSHPPRLVSIYKPLLIFKFYPLLLSQLLQTIFFFLFPLFITNYISEWGARATILIGIPGSSR